MERVNKFGIMAVRGETKENILDFEELFDCDFGDPFVKRQSLGVRGRETENAGAICIRFKTGNLTETNVGFGLKLSPMALMIMRGQYKMYLSDHPWAHDGDEGNITESPEKPVTFVSGDGKDPQNKTRQGYVKNPKGGYMMGEVPIAKRPDGGLRPNTVYYYTYRLTNTEGELFAQHVVYQGSDDPEHGGEELIVMGDGIPFTLGNISGIAFLD